LSSILARLASLSPSSTPSAIARLIASEILLFFPDAETETEVEESGEEAGWGAELSSAAGADLFGAEAALAGVVGFVK